MCTGTVVSPLWSAPESIGIAEYEEGGNRNGVEVGMSTRISRVERARGTIWECSIGRVVSVW